ncbi:MAG: alpha/beta fold hydrolase, partial [Acidobacteria bacterium]|nr:alpha/beta fold hydrolase [Acidobacteriota bacterium]
VDRKALPEPDGRPSWGSGGYLPPRNLVELQLVGLWEEILGVHPIGVRDGFFELGGHSLSAVRLTARIEQRFERRLPLVRLFEKPTIEHLASVLRREGEPEEATPLVPLKVSGSKLPFFCVHPAGGGAFSYLPLARHFDPERPFYALEAQGLGAAGELDARLEDMAARYLHEIRTVQAQGPYLLGGWSLGGFVALEMAQQLRDAGDEVAGLVLLDTFADHQLEELLREENQLSLLATFARDLGLSPEGFELPEEAARGELAPGELLEAVRRQAGQSGILPPEISLDHAERLFEVFKANVQAVAAYRPEPYDGALLVFRAEQGSTSAGDALGWDRLSRGTIAVQEVPGDHFTMVVEPHVQELARRLSASFDQPPTPQGDADGILRSDI